MGAQEATWQGTYVMSARLAPRTSMSNPQPHSTGKVAALVVAAGRGIRSGLELPKQYTVIGGKTVLARAIDALRSHEAVGDVLVVIGDGQESLYRDAVKGITGLLPPVAGGASRQASVRNGLEALAARSPEIVLVHDAARPFVNRDTIGCVIDA